MAEPTRGRRRGSPDTRARIREAARARFLADGYQAVTMRAIAADAGVDVALLSYYFGSKQGLFGAALALPANPAAVFASALPGDPATLGTRVLGALMGVWDSPETGPPLVAMATAAAGDPDLRRLVREAVGREIVERLAAHLGEPDAAGRASAFVIQTSGLVFARYVLQLEPIASMSAAEVLARLGPALQVALEP